MNKQLCFALLVFSIASSSYADDQAYDVAVLDYQKTLNTDLYDVNEAGLVVGETVKLEGHYAITYKVGKTSVVSSKMDEEDSFVVGGIDSFSQIFGSKIISNSSNFKAVQLVKNALQEIPQLQSYPYSVASAVAENGAVVGAFKKSATAETEAYILNAGTLKILPGLSSKSSLALAINSAGFVVGSSVTKDGKLRAVLWDASGKITDLGALDYVSSRAKSINTMGQVVGILWNDLNEGGEQERGQAFLYSDSQIKKLGTLGGYYSEPSSINDHGVIVGASTTSNKERHAFIYQNGKMTDLNTILNRPDIKFIQARDINNSGVIVGYGYKGNKAVGIVLTPHKNS